MPGKGKTESRASAPEEQNAGFGTAPTLDVYLNATAYWKNIPQPVYNFTIGGYQVIKKMVALSGTTCIGPRAQDGRDPGSHRYSQASRRAGAAATQAR